jgi:hypothetical protein
MGEWVGEGGWFMKRMKENKKGKNYAVFYLAGKRIF